MPGGRISRKEMKRDELVTTVSVLTDMAERHKKSLIFAAVAVVVLLVAIAVGMSYSGKRQLEAQARLGALQRVAATPVGDFGGLALPAGSYFPDPQQKYQEVVRLADELLEQHPSSRVAPWAVFYKADGLRHTGDADGALALLAPLVEGETEDLFQASCLIMQAQIHEQRGQKQEALDVYMNLAASAPDRFPPEMALMNQARLLEDMGRQEEAVEVYRRITQEYPDSPYAQESRLKIAPELG